MQFYIFKIFKVLKYLNEKFPFQPPSYAPEYYQKIII